MKKQTLCAILLTGSLVAGSLGIIGCFNKKTDLEYGVPFTKMYETTARQLSAEEADEVSGFYKGVGKHIKIKEINPITIDGKDIEKVPSTNPAVRKIQNVKKFRSCFYNSKDHSLEAKTGVFVAQGLSFKDKESAERLKEDFLKGLKNHYKAVLYKDNTVVAVNMFLPNLKPTKELKELVDFAKKQGFSLVEYYPTI